MRSRRSFLGLGAVAFAAASLPDLALAADGGWIVSYFWSHTLARVIEQRQAVAGVLGPELGSRLIVVHGTSGLWGLVDDGPGPYEAAVRQVARDRDARLRAALGGDSCLAAAMPDRDYERTFKVGYGPLPSESEARSRLELVARLLGPAVRAALTLEVDEDGWQPVYQRFGDSPTTEALARTHAGILARYHIPATSVPDRYFDPRWPRAAPAPADPPPSEPPREAEAEVVRAPAPQTQPPDLPATIDTPLRDAINDHIQDLRKQQVLSSDETTSWYVQTLHDDRTWVAINAERSLQCASMVKPYIALAFLHRVQEGRIAYGDTSRSKLEAMIQYSNNTAANWAMDTVGGPAAVQRLLTEHYGHLLPETTIVERIPRSGRTYQNRSSARDYVRFCRALWRDELPRSAELKRLMALPGHDRLYTGAPAIPECTQIMDKTGTTAQLCGDFGILVAQTHGGQKIPYVIVGIIEKSCSVSSYHSWVESRSEVIRGVSNLTYEALKEHYGLV